MGEIQADALIPIGATARSVLAQPDFRRLYVSTFSSSVGSWMQTVVVGPLALRLSGGRESFVGLLMLAQLGPLLGLSIPAGAMAARIRNRARYMVALQCVQIACAVFLAVVAARSHPDKWMVLLGVLGGGIANALNGPVYQSVLPEIVGRENIPAAVSLGSAQVNGSRVIGPVALAIISQFWRVRPSTVFAFNAVTFLAVIWAVLTIHIPPPPEQPAGTVGFRSLGRGFAELRVNPVARRCLLVMFVFSLLSLSYVPQFPSIAEGLNGIDSASRSYLVLFGVWGFGALCGALSMSTVLARVDKRPLPQVLLGGFALLMALWSVQRGSGIVLHLVLFALGFCYFGTTTAINTVLQQHLTSTARPYVLSLWFMCFGGTVPLAGLWAGWVMDSSLGARRGAAVVLLVGAVVAGLLSLRANLRRVKGLRAPGVQAAR